MQVFLRMSTLLNYYCIGYSFIDINIGGSCRNTSLFQLDRCNQRIIFFVVVRDAADLVNQNKPL